MSDPFLIIAVVIISVVLLVAIAIAMVQLSSPEDKNGAWFPKIIVLFSLYIACMNVIILPIDIYNVEHDDNINIKVMWAISIGASAICLFVLIPFAYIYYENDTLPEESTTGCGCIPGWNTQLASAAKWTLACSASFTALIIITYYAIYVPTTGEINHVTFSEYMTALMAFMGWFLFTIYCGNGLVALPWDLFNEWHFRPTPIELGQYAEEKKRIGRRASFLRKAGEQLKNDKLNHIGNKVSRGERRHFQHTLNRFEEALNLLKRDFYHLQVSYKNRGGNPIGYWLKLFLSIIGASISLMWIVHICVFVLPDHPSTPFLNNLFDGLNSEDFPLMGFAAFCCYSFWLLLCVIKGNFRFGMRFACCNIFPIEVNNTMMNSFLINCWLILISSIVVVQFSAISFPIYAEGTEIDMLFNEKVVNLQFFKYFFDNHVFVYCLLACCVLSACWMFFMPLNRAKEVEKQLDEIMKGDKKIDKKQLKLVAVI